MNKKIKIIDLLNKIANGEEVPKKVKYLNRIYKFYKGEKDYISYDNEETKWCGQTLLFNIMECHHITELLEAEVEILEDNTEEIEEKSNFENMGYEIAQAYFDFYKGIAKALAEKRKESEDKQ